MHIGLHVIGNSVIRSVRSYFRMLTFLGLLIISLFQCRKYASEFNRYEFVIHSYQYGPRILPKTTLFAVLVSSFLTIFVIRELTLYNSLEYLGSAISMLLVRELGPLLIAFFMIIYASIAIFDELEDVKLHLHDPDSAVDSCGFIYDEILPRFAAILLCMPLLFIYFVLVSFFIVSFWINISDQVSISTFYSQLQATTTNHDFIVGFIKVTLFALVNAFFACFYGMQHEPDPLHKSLPLTKSILVNLGFLIFTGVVIEIVAFSLNY